MRLIPVLALALTASLWSNAVLAKKPTRPHVSSSRHGRGMAVTSNKRPPVSRRRNEYEDGEDDSFGADPLDPLVDEDEDEDGDENGDDNEMEDEIVRPVGKPKRAAAVAASPRSSQHETRPSKKNRRDHVSRQRSPVPRYDEEEDEFEDGDDDYVPPRRDAGRPGPGQRGAPPSRRGPPPRGINARNNGRRSPGGGGGRGRVVPYVKPGQGAAAAFTKGWSAVVSVLPDPAFVKEAALSGISAAKQTTSSLSANIYREVKGLTSSELEQVMLKATRPDDTAVKGKHVERLVGVTYQISSRYDIYDAVLRKLWSKMAEKDWRTTVKALYILHRFAADGSPEHAPALKARLRELRRTRDPKRKDKFFNSKQLLAGDASPENIKFRAFMSRYAHYVLLRTQCFGGMFDEISSVPKPDKKRAVVKPITSTSLRAENYNAAEMLLKAGVVCQLKDGEECENTAIASERVASDMIGLTTAVAMALNRALKDSDLKGADPVLLKKWCLFYSTELLPQTKSMVKKISPKLDAYGLFLPSRMGTSVAPDLLEKGLNLKVEPDDSTTEPPDKVAEEEESVDPGAVDSAEKAPAPTSKEVDRQSPATPTSAQSEPVANKVAEQSAEEDDEYEYEEEEYYDEDEA